MRGAVSSASHGAHPRGGPRRRVIAGVVVFVVAMALGGPGFRYGQRRIAEARLRDLEDSCRRRGTMFADRLRSADDVVELQVEREAFGYRVHYNHVERRCFVMTEGYRKAVADVAIVSSQVWDADASRATTPVATQHRMRVLTSFEPVSPRSYLAGFRVYRGKVALPAGRASMAWFEELMLE